MKKKWIAMMLTIVMTTGMLTGCGSSDSDTAAGDNGQTNTGNEQEAASVETQESGEHPEKHMVVLENRSPDAPAAKALRAVAEAYAEEVNPNFTLEQQYVPDMVTYKQKIKTLIASDEIPDMFAMDADPYARTLLEEGVLMDITEICEKYDLSQYYYESAFDWGAFSDGVQVGLPVESDIEMFWYNTEIFEQAGVKVPETMDEFMDVCQQLKDYGVTPIAMAGKEPWTMIRYLTFITYRLEGNDYVNGLVRGDRKMSEDTGKAAAQFVYDLGTKGYFQDGFASYDMASAQDYFLGGNAAIYYVGTWELDSFQDENLNDDMKGKIDYFTLPEMEGGVTTANQFNAHGGTPYAFGTQNFDEETESFIVYFAQNYGKYVSEYIFAAQKGCDAPNDTELTQKVAADIERVEGVVRLLDVDTDPTTNEVLNKEVISLALGEQTVDEFCQKIDDSIAQNAPSYFTW